MKRIQELLDDDEAALARDANTANTGEISEVRVTAQLYLAHRLREVTNDLMASNEKLAKVNGASNEKLARSNNRYAGALNILTFFLVLVGVLQAFVIWRVSSTP